MKVLSTNNIVKAFIDKGWTKSLENELCMNIDGDFLPWYGYAVIEFLKERLTKEISVFEYGCGTSSLFYAKRCKEVFSTDVNVEWFEKISSFKKELQYDNLKLFLTENVDEFVRQISLIKKTFDIIVVDSEKRNDCIEFCTNFLNENGVIILDNSERKSYQKSFDFLRSLNFKHINFTSIGPLRDKESRTTIFYKKNNIFQI